MNLLDFSYSVLVVIRQLLEDRVIFEVDHTIADLEGCAYVLTHHIMEAIAYRNLDRPSYMSIMCKLD